MVITVADESKQVAMVCQGFHQDGGDSIIDNFLLVTDSQGRLKVGGIGVRSPFKSVFFTGEFENGIFYGGVTTLESGQAQSFVFWVRRQLLTGRGVVVMNATSTAPSSEEVEMAIYFDTNDRVVFAYAYSLNSTVMSARSTVQINDTDWHHVIITYDGSESNNGISIYVDGVAGTEGVTDTLTGGLSQTPANFEIGFDNQGVFQNLGLIVDDFIGRIDEIILYNIELTAVQAALVYNEGEVVSPLALATAPSVVSWWRMGEGASTASSILDELGNNNSSSTVGIQIIDDNPWRPANISALTGPTTPDPTSGFNNYSLLYPDVAAATVSIGDVLSKERTDTFSISLWFKKTISNVINRGLISKNQFFSNRGGYDISINLSNKLEFRFINTTLTAWRVSGGPTISINTWYHVVATYDGLSNQNGMRIYINGSLAATGSASAITGTTVSAGVLQLGNVADSNNNWVGYIDEVSIWDKELSSTEVSELYNSGSPASVTSHSASVNAEAWWRMGDGDTLPTIQDQIGSNDGTAASVTIEAVSPGG